MEPTPQTGKQDNLPSRLSPFRKFLKRFHPEAIPSFGAVLYNAISKSSIFQRHYQLVAQDVLSYCPHGSLLDIGTGPAWLLLELHRFRPALRLTGIDISPAMVAKARENIAAASLTGAIEVRESGAARLPFPDCSFDTVVSTASLHHWKDPTACLLEIYRVLKPAGFALLYDLVTDTPAPVWQDALRQFGRLKMALLWIHSFEEPFFTSKAFELLPASTPFPKTPIRFLGLLCALTLQKPLT